MLTSNLSALDKIYLRVKYLEACFPPFKGKCWPTFSCESPSGRSFFKEISRRHWVMIPISVFSFSEHSHNQLLPLMVNLGWFYHADQHLKILQKDVDSKIISLVMSSSFMKVPHLFSC